MFQIIIIKTKNERLTDADADAFFCYKKLTLQYIILKGLSFLILYNLPFKIKRSISDSQPYV